MYLLTGCQKMETYEIYNIYYIIHIQWRAFTQTGAYSSSGRALGYKAEVVDGVEQLKSWDMYYYSVLYVNRFPLVGLQEEGELWTR